MQAIFSIVQISVLSFKGIKCWNITDSIMKKTIEYLIAYDNILQPIRHYSISSPNYQEPLEIISHHLIYLEENTVII